MNQKIFGLNSAHLYGLDIKMAQGPAFSADKIATIKQEYLALGGDHSNTYYGYVAKKNRVA